MPRSARLKRRLTRGFAPVTENPLNDLSEFSRPPLLRPGGFLQFSILHPCFVPPHRRVLREADGRTVRAVEVGGYFDNIDGRVDRWWFGAASQEERARVPPFQEPRFHRTLSAWINLVVASGFVLDRLGEPYADEATAVAVPAVADTRVAPLFLHVRGHKPAPDELRRYT